MGYVDLVDDTIFALITAPGTSGVAVIRVSGPLSLISIRKICPFLPPKPESHRVYFGHLLSSTGDVVDEVLVSYFAKGRSFTGDETVEISCHGGYINTNRILYEVGLCGIRPAERGEFSFRAFYNGKVDLVQAEGILSIIESKSESARQIAIRQLKGHLSNQFIKVEEQLISILAQLEASIDFSTEDIEPYSLAQISELVAECSADVHRILSTYNRGRVIQNGYRVLLAGPANAGKSSLYNALLEQDRAIVTEIAGTTRDLLESPFYELGSSVSIIDSAGLRSSEDKVEILGMSKSIAAMAEVDTIFYVVDGQQIFDCSLTELGDYLDKVEIVVNKMDMLSDSHEDIQRQITDYLLTRLSVATLNIHFVSALKGQGIQDIKDRIKTLSLVDLNQNESLITQYRHFDYLNKAAESLSRANTLLVSGESFDLIALEIQSALKEILALLGKEYDDQVLDRVFKQFCLGK